MNSNTSEDGSSRGDKTNVDSKIYVEDSDTDEDVRSSRTLYETDDDSYVDTEGDSLDEYESSSWALKYREREINPRTSRPYTIKELKEIDDMFARLDACNEPGFGEDEPFDPEANWREIVSHANRCARSPTPSTDEDEFLYKKLNVLKKMKKKFEAVNCPHLVNTLSLEIARVQGHILILGFDTEPPLPRSLQKRRRNRKKRNGNTNANVAAARNDAHAAGPSTSRAAMQSVTNMILPLRLNIPVLLTNQKHNGSSSVPENSYSKTKNQKFRQRRRRPEIVCPCRACIRMHVRRAQYPPPPPPKTP